MYVCLLQNSEHPDQIVFASRAGNNNPTGVVCTGSGGLHLGIMFFKPDIIYMREFFHLSEDLLRFLPDHCHIFILKMRFLPVQRKVIYFFTDLTEEKDYDYFVSQVLSAFNDMIPDNALEWEPVSCVG